MSEEPLKKGSPFLLRFCASAGEELLHDDLRTLNQLRSGWNTDSGSMRTTAFHWQLNLTCLANMVHPGNFPHEAQELARQLDSAKTLVNIQLSEAEQASLRVMMGLQFEVYLVAILRPDTTDKSWTCPYQTGHRHPVKLMFQPSV